MLLVKLGGSVITDKSKLRTARPLVLDRLAREAATAKDDLILVHGAGSFGHILAEKYSLHKGYHDDSQLEGVAEVQRDVRGLNLMVVDALREAGARPISIPPGIAVKFSGGMLRELDVDLFKEYLRLRMIPVTFGDVVLDDTWRFSICSGDDLMLELSRVFRPTKSIFVADVDGVFTGDPKAKGKGELLREIRTEDVGKVNLSMRSGADVTGGLEGKLRKMFEAAGHAGESWILNGLVAGRLKDAIAGKSFVGTRVVA